MATGADDRSRCHWCTDSPELLHYHDREWGFPVCDDVPLFEKLSLELFQSGLSWRTILAKRENFRSAFHQFDFNAIAHFSQHDVERLLGDQGIVRHRGKIEAVLHNARQAQDIVRQEGSLSAFVWRYEPHMGWEGKMPPEALSLAHDLKKRGWKFVGPTTVYAFMQAAGLVNDHEEDCRIRDRVESARKSFKRTRC